MKRESDYVRRSIVNGKAWFEMEYQALKSWQSKTHEEREKIIKEYEEDIAKMSRKLSREFGHEVKSVFCPPDKARDLNINLQQEKESFVKEIAGKNKDVNSFNMISTEEAPALINELLGDSPTPYQVLIASHLLTSIKNIWVLGRLKQGAWTLKQLKDRFSAKDFKGLNKFVDNLKDSLKKQEEELKKSKNRRIITIPNWNEYLEVKTLLKMKQKNTKWKSEATLLNGIRNTDATQSEEQKHKQLLFRDWFYRARKNEPEHRAKMEKDKEWYKDNKGWCAASEKEIINRVENEYKERELKRKGEKINLDRTDRKWNTELKKAKRNNPD